METIQQSSSICRRYNLLINIIAKHPIRKDLLDLAAKLLKISKLLMYKLKRKVI